jgi:hypothetical protein
VSTHAKQFPSRAARSWPASENGAVRVEVARPVLRRRVVVSLRRCGARIEHSSAEVAKLIFHHVRIVAIVPKKHMARMRRGACSVQFCHADQNTNSSLCYRFDRLPFKHFAIENGCTLLLIAKWHVVYCR